jgi:Ca-activated chloride channel homolog
MSFLWPVAFLLLWLVPIGITLYVRLQQRRKRLVAAYGSMGFTQSTAFAQSTQSTAFAQSTQSTAFARRGDPGLRRHIPPFLFMIGLMILVFALARPQMVVSLPRVEGTVILAFDVSGSMGADDLKPTRMDAAKAAAQEFVQHQPITLQIGVVAFSDSGFAVQAPTNDREAILAAINRLTPQRGTSLGHGIQAALQTITSGTGQTTHQYSNLTPVPTPTPTPVPKGTYTPAVVVLLSDGENNESPDPLAMAQTASDRGVRIFTVGIGSPTGADVKINGFTMHTQLDEQTLQQIAQLSGGAYFNAQSAQDLRSIYDKLQAQLIVKPEQTEVTAIFAGAGILVLLLGGLLSLMWFSRLP